MLLLATCPVRGRIQGMINRPTLSVRAQKRWCKMKRILANSERLDIALNLLTNEQVAEFAESVQTPKTSRIR